MPWDEKSALEHEHVSYAQKFISEYTFLLGSLSLPITIRIYKHVFSDPAMFDTIASYAIKTPTQVSPYGAHKTYQDSAEYALSQAVMNFTLYYSEAIEAGHEPNDSWLVPNEHFYKVEKPEVDSDPS